MNLDTPSIWVGTWAAYNNGILHGAWIDCTLGVDHIYDEINKILETCPEQGEEYGIFDISALPNFINEHSSDFENIAAWAKALEEHGEIIASLAKELNIEDIEEVLEYHENHYHGCANSFDEFAQNFFDDIYGHEVPEHLQHYIDYEAFARDLSYDYFEIWFDGECHVWRNN